MSETNENSTHIKTTIVTGFLSNVNTRYENVTEAYLDNCKLFLKTTTPKIVFLDDLMLSHIGKEDYDPSTTLIIRYNQEDLYYMRYVDKITKFPNKQNSQKDTKKYLLLMCNKTEYLREAIRINPYNTDNFVWIDFGIRYIMKNTSDEEFVEKLNKVAYSHHSKIRIGGIWNPIKVSYSLDIFKDILWYFAGGVVGGDKCFLIQFADEMRCLCESIVSTHHTIMWEVNLWYLIYKNRSYWFDIYPSSHDETLVDGYYTPYPLTNFI